MQINATYSAAIDTAPAQAHRTRLLGLINASWTTQVIATAVEIGLPDAMADGPRTVAALAETSATHAPSLYRLLRAMVSLELCDEDHAGNFGLTPAGSLLRTAAADSLCAWAAMSGTRSWLLWGRLAESVRTGESIRKRTLADDDFTHLDDDAQAAALFNRAMAELTVPVATDIARAIDFSGVSRVVDVGGGYGQLLCSVLASHPKVHGVLFDMAHAIEKVTGHFCDAGVADRCEVVTGSFFDDVPAGADVYMLKSILHDWDDERCLTILRACRRAMPPGARLLIVERVASAKAGASPYDQFVARADLHMMVANGGCERTEDAYRNLLESCGLQLAQVTPLSNAFSALTAVRL